MSAEQDAKVLHKALSGFNTDERTLISIIAHRDPYQLTTIQQWYQHSYNDSLLKKIKSKTSGDFGRCLHDAAKEPAMYDCELIHEACTGVNTQEGVMMEVLLRRSNADVMRLRQQYQLVYGHDLIKVVKAAFTGYLEKLMVASLQGTRDEVGVFDATPDVHALRQAGEGRIGTDETVFIGIFTSRSDQHLRNVFAMYQQMYGKHISKVIKSEFSGDLETALLTIVKIVEDAPLWVAELLESAMAGIGTNERRLSRVIVRNRGAFMEYVKQAFHKRYGKTLRRRIEKETSGDYKHLLLHLINDYM